MKKLFYKFKVLIISPLGVFYLIYWNLRNLRVTHSLRVIWIFFYYRFKFLLKRNRLNIVDLGELRRKRKSNTIFIFGSGSSLNDIPFERWQSFAEADTLGFNSSIYLKKLCFTYMLLPAWNESPDVCNGISKTADSVARLIVNSKFLKRTTFIFPDELTSLFSNALINAQAWNISQTVSFYKLDRWNELPTLFPPHLVSKCNGTLCVAINIAAHLGYKRIVLVGVDLYDNRYFFLPKDKTSDGNFNPSDKTPRGLLIDQPHYTVHSGIIQTIARWNSFLAKRDISLFIENPKSLLAEVLPVFK